MSTNTHKQRDRALHLITKEQEKHRLLTGVEKSVCEWPSNCSLDNLHSGALSGTVGTWCNPVLYLISYTYCVKQDEFEKVMFFSQQ